MEIYIIRHTAVGVPRGICYGQTDVPLKDTFKAEAEAVKRNLSKYCFDAVYSSPLSRCRRLADYCGYSDALLDSRLKELNFGDWEMGKWHELDMSIWEKDWVCVPTPNGESFEQLYERLAHFLEELKQKTYERVAVFAHGGIIGAAKSYFGQQDLIYAFDNVVDYGSINEFKLR